MTNENVQPKWNEHGLAPAIVQDAKTGEVLMLAWVNAEAWRLTQVTGEAHFWSRSRQQLWHKGETSGHVQRVREIRLDCDSDAVLLRVEPAGPACHTGERSCFFNVVGSYSGDSERPFDFAQGRREESRSHAGETLRSAQGDNVQPAVGVLDELYQIILDRKQNPRPGSYTAQLFEKGMTEIAKKVGEESVEVIVAALGQSDARLISEAADLMYHSLVMLAARGVSFGQVEAELEKRRR